MVDLSVIMRYCFMVATQFRLRLIINILGFCLRQPFHGYQQNQISEQS